MTDHETPHQTSAVVPAPGEPVSGTGFCQVLTTTDSRTAALDLAQSVVRDRLAACAQVLGPISSVYWWDGQVQTAEEWQCVMKTTEDRYPALAAHLSREHSYDVPEILCLPVSAGSPDYLAWIRTETR